VIPPLILNGPDEQSKFEQWMKRHRPDGVIGNYPDVAASWMSELRMEAAYASLDCTDRPCAGIRQSWSEIFSTAVDQLAAELARNEFGLPKSPKVTLIEGTWITGRPAKTGSPPVR
jgi:LacI family transcriptional regulator